MIAKVICTYRDKHTLELHKRGEVVTLTEERYSELMAAGNYVFRITQKTPENVPEIDTINVSPECADASETAVDASGDAFDEMSMRELREYADKTYKLTFKVGTKKADIIEKLRNMERTSN